MLKLFEIINQLQVKKLWQTLPTIEICGLHNYSHQQFLFSVNCIKKTKKRPRIVLFDKVLIHLHYLGTSNLKVSWISDALSGRAALQSTVLAEFLSFMNDKFL